MSNQEYTTTINIYYEDTDFSGAVYHANFLKYFERAREHAIGQKELVRLWHEAGIGFVVYKAEMQFAEAVVFGDVLEIRSTYEMEGPYRINWHHEAWRPHAKKAAVKATVQLVCVDRERQLVPIPTGTY